MALGLTAAGACCIVAGSSGWGLLIARQLRRRPAELARLAGALQSLRTEVDYARTPLPQALRRAGQSDAGPAGLLLRGTAERLDRGGGAGPADAWSAALAEAGDRSAWAPSDVEELTRLGQALGGSDAADQVRHLALAIARLHTAEGESAALAERQARMWSYLGVLAGLALVLAVL